MKMSKKRENANVVAVADLVLIAGGTDGSSQTSAVPVTLGLHKVTFEDF